MTTRPKVSVIIPTHNRSAFLRSAIISVLNQTFQDFEIIIIDDASKDDTRKVITSFNEARIRGIHNQASKGAAGSRNIGVTKDCSRCAPCSCSAKQLDKGCFIIVPRGRRRKQRNSNRCSLGFQHSRANPSERERWPSSVNIPAIWAISIRSCRVSGGIGARR